MDLFQKAVEIWTTGAALFGERNIGIQDQPGWKSQTSVVGFQSGLSVLLLAYRAAVSLAGK